MNRRLRMIHAVDWLRQRQEDAHARSLACHFTGDADGRARATQRWAAYRAAADELQLELAATGPLPARLAIRTVTYHCQANLADSQTQWAGESRDPG